MSLGRLSFIGIGRHQPRPLDTVSWWENGVDVSDSVRPRLPQNEDEWINFKIPELPWIR
ncbi:hypothetical protein OHA72_56555 [Dactylosporangium sp. NBC_01737]|uniref:hypothetical protein n=1 Tax=Dactylosporangium sp. NBC_01737 TaxID=2975959 RepID=UPI002E1474F2|nr:hypothetical protein OHA72_56555 [Dactylosporangium sp. NBC_01737]